jgi:hypothetical protein
MKCDDFAGCDIESYVLNVSGDNNGKIRVYVSKLDDGTWCIR